MLPIGRHLRLRLSAGWIGPRVFVSREFRYYKPAALDRAPFDTVISRFSIVRLLFAYRTRRPLVNIEFDFIASYGSRKRIFNGPYIYLCR